MSNEATAERAVSCLPSPGKLAETYRRIRGFSEAIAAPLEPEDCVIQSMPDVSPTRWHLAHTTWFFETFLLKAQPDYEVFDPRFDYLFNSYYNTVGAQFPRDKRGLLSRPTVDEVMEYRSHVDHSLLTFLKSATPTPEQRSVLEIGLQHEQQHQELMLTDIKHVLSCNPLFPAYAETNLPSQTAATPADFVRFPGGLHEIGHQGPEFAYDNEAPRHQVLAQPFQLSDRLVTVGEYLEFIQDGGYQQPHWWLSLGWQTVAEQGWTAPLYWHQIDGTWHDFTLSGLHPIQLDAPVCHVSYFEADAYARWAGARLPSEAEWEIAAENVPVEGTFADQLIASGTTVHPSSCPQPPTADQAGAAPLRQLFGDVWEWTHSPYMPYPGYSALDGALGEYNGKFMCGQFVLRGGSCATPSNHVRRTYRNFFPPSARWQFSGIRLARD